MEACAAQPLTSESHVCLSWKKGEDLWNGTINGSTRKGWWTSGVGRHVARRQGRAVGGAYEKGHIAPAAGSIRRGRDLIKIDERGTGREEGEDGDWVGETRWAK